MTSNKLSKHDKFIIKAKTKHGEMYDLSKIVYISSEIPITVICKTHGEFNKIPSEFLRDSGCRLCSIENRKDSWVDVRKELTRIHTNKFDYSRTVYVNNKTKFDVRCLEHDVVFSITPQNHKIFGGCPSCRQDGYGKHLRLSKEDFIKKAEEIHQEKQYDYTESEYIGYNYPISIICPAHGNFTIKTKNHLRGQGCPNCK